MANGENREALRDVYDKLTNILHATAMMLRGADKESKPQNADDGYDSGVNSDNDTEVEAAARGLSRNTNVSQERPGTGAVGDIDAASTISGMSQKQKGEPQPQNSEPDGDGNANNKMMLFPSQIQKISNIIAVLSHKRNLVERLIHREEEWQALKNPTDSFDWQCHARCSWEEEQQACKIDILDMQFDYGFEYQGSTSRLVLSPLTDKCFVGLAQAVKNKMVGVCNGELVSVCSSLMEQLESSLPVRDSACMRISLKLCRMRHQRIGALVIQMYANKWSCSRYLSLQTKYFGVKAKKPSFILFK